MNKLRLICFSVLSAMMLTGPAARAEDLFQRGAKEYAAAHFESAAEIFREAASLTPAAGTLHNLGNAEWQASQAGPAILAWERAQWLSPFNRDTANNLRFARRTMQLDAPELAWYEICSTWLPVDLWPWLAMLSFWLAVALIMLPGIFGWRRSGWHQGLAAASFAVFLLTIPALAGVHTRSRLGVILPNSTPLRLTPTGDAQFVSRLPTGETARLERERGNYVFIRTANASGWVERAQFGLIAK